ncbi:S1C family serine protease [Salibacterium qingdaonense]|uniref:HtrA-like peptidase. Serine peptidase. MEROPS family S01B n=1 Tax=Salibacterium qingdaonense TaxID=266892 RepID=A0A1I4NC16_9BACI|nr:S1C family serine protease [Salibacterium qingdaonense]SFM12857.1 htrA-like peptidase. Serine peptidase. MEROPS family S01B [Salibacterium qingdaonense]
MGYDNNHGKGPSQRRKRQQKRIGQAALAGAVIGAVLVLFAVPFLYESSLFPGTGDDNPKEGLEAQQPPEDISFQGEAEQMQVSVQSDTTEAVEKVSDAVVGVFNLQQSDFWEEENGSGASQGTGSGVIYKMEGNTAFVVTNHHVIEGAGQVEVSLSNDTRVDAEVIGSDVLTDLAVLQIDAQGVETAASFGNSDNLNVGEPAIAIGNPLGTQLSRTVTRGIISAVERSIPVDLNGDGESDWNAEVIQTDAAINPGNSGGALVNINGQLIGINSMKIAQSSVEGIGFAIPTSVAVPVIEDLEANGEVKRPQMGITLRSLSEIPSYHWQETLQLPQDVDNGIFITNVVSGTPAEQAGLKRYDVITAMNGTPIADGHDLRRYLYTKVQMGDTITITFYREGQQQTTDMTLNNQRQF